MSHTLHPDHILPKKSDRIKKAKHAGERYLCNMFNKVDDVLDFAYADYCNGISRSDVIQKLMQGIYPPQEGKKMPYRSALVYFNTVLERMAYNTDIELSKLKDVFYSRYEALFEEAVKNGDVSAARQILDSMSKIFGVQQQTPQTAVQVNANTDGVTINFGFGNNKEDE